MASDLRWSFLWFSFITSIKLSLLEYFLWSTFRSCDFLYKAFGFSIVKVETEIFFNRPLTACDMQRIQNFLGSSVWIFFFCFSNLYKERHIDPKRIGVRIFTNPFSSLCCENIGYTVRFRHLSKCQPQMILSIGNDYDVIFLPKWRTQIWGKIDLGGHRFEWEAIPKDTYLHCKRTRIWGYSNFIGHGFVGRHESEAVHGFESSIYNLLQ